MDGGGGGAAFGGEDAGVDGDAEIGRVIELRRGELAAIVAAAAAAEVVGEGVVGEEGAAGGVGERGLAGDGAEETEAELGGVGLEVEGGVVIDLHLREGGEREGEEEEQAGSHDLSRKVMDSIR